jgi:2-polyprenyl-3-methyl-5-hydroxy-6-metoxy-1,4-benzoquinol methylase
MICHSKNADFVIKELNLKPQDSVLFLGCQTGAELAIELANLGYKVTCVDNDPAILAPLKEHCNILTVNCPVKDYQTSEIYDAALSIFGNSFCVFNTNDNIWGKDMAILGNLSEMLKPNGGFLITLLNASRFMRSLTDAEIENSTANIWQQTQTNKNNPQQTLRYYSPAEFTRMVNRVGLRLNDVYGYNDGPIESKKLMPDDHQFIALGNKKV